MEILMKYLQCFAVGGAICLIAQILLNLTKLTPARILVIFLLSGVFLETIGKRPVPAAPPSSGFLPEPACYW